MKKMDKEKMNKGREEERRQRGGRKKRKVIEGCHGLMVRNEC